MSSRPEHPGLVPVELFLAAQPRPRRREKARIDAEPTAGSPHRQTKSAYRLRSYVYCVPCGLRMHGKRNSDRQLKPLHGIVLPARRESLAARAAASRSNPGTSRRWTADNGGHTAWPRHRS